MADRFIPRGQPRPLHWHDLTRREMLRAETRDIPAELQPRWNDLSATRRFESRIVRKANVEAGQMLQAPSRPPWLDGTYKPAAAARLARPLLTHRGIGVDPLVVWGADDRRTYDDTNYPWGCVCRVLSRGAGSGVLVGPRHVLTASHCIDWSSAAATVEVNRFRTRVSATAQAIAVWRYTEIGDVGASTVDEDYAVIVLDQRLGDRFGWMGVRTYDSGWDDENLWRNIGYPGDIAGGIEPTYQRDKSMDEDEWDYGSGRAMTTAADVKKGQSGGPMFAFWDDGPYVVAVVSAEGNIFASGTENWCSGGSDLTSLVSQARAGDP